MAEQLACLLSTIRSTVDGFEPHFVQTMIAGERFSGSINRTPDGTLIDVTKDFVPSGLDTVLGLTLCYVYADETRITLADSNANYHVLWRSFIDNELADTTLEPKNNMTSGNLLALQTYLVNRLGYSANVISNWLIDKFNVANQAALVEWSTTRPRTKTVQKIMQSLSDFASAKVELDA